MVLNKGPKICQFGFSSKIQMALLGSTRFVGLYHQSITSGPEVRQIFKIRTFRKPDVFLIDKRTDGEFECKYIKVGTRHLFSYLWFSFPDAGLIKIEKKSKKRFYFSKLFFKFFFHNFCVYLHGKMFKPGFRLVRPGNSYAQSVRAALSF